jgi:DNA-binding response OmpR family regulator
MIESNALVSNSKLKIMLIEDEHEIREILKSLLEDEGFEVIALENGIEVMSQLQKHLPHFLIVDQLMPVKKGVEVIHEIRAQGQFSKIPIIMLSALSSESDKVKALEIGADDYVTKPFQAKELCARIRALHRRTLAEKEAKKIDSIHFANLVVDFIGHRVLIDQVEVPLTLTEFKILTELLKQGDQVLSREGLRERALGNLNVSDRTIDVHMAALRKKLGTVGDSIHTVRGVGYRFSGQPEFAPIRKLS